MKRLFVIPLVGVMLAALAVPVLAEENSATATQSTDSTPITIQGKYEGDSGTATVFSVDIKWGNMKAIYAPNRSSTWNPTTLEETTIDSDSSHWRWEQGTSSNGLQTNEIAITNHSNTSINCVFEFNSSDDFPDVDANVCTLATENALMETNEFGIGNAMDAQGITLDEKLKNLTRSGFVTLTGELNKSITEFTTIGTISVTISER